MSKKIKELHKNYPIVVGFVTMVLILAMFHGMGVLVHPAYQSDSYYTAAMLMEVAACVITIGVMKLNGTFKILKEKGTGILSGFLAGGYLVFVLVLTLVVKCRQVIDSPTARLVPVGKIFVFVMYMLSIGVFEELLFRGIVFSPIMKKYGKNEGGVWLALLVSGGLFGAIHMTNALMGADVSGVIVQAVVASGLGILLAAIYIRSNNIYSTILLHALIDFVALLPSGLFGLGSMINSLSDYQPVQMFQCVIYLIVTAVILRKSKLDEILEREMNS